MATHSSILAWRIPLCFGNHKFVFYICEFACFRANIPKTCLLFTKCSLGSYQPENIECSQDILKREGKLSKKAMSWLPTTPFNSGYCHTYSPYRGDRIQSLPSRSSHFLGRQMTGNPKASEPLVKNCEL